MPLLFTAYDSDFKGTCPITGQVSLSDRQTEPKRRAAGLGATAQGHALQRGPGFSRALAG
jgi:hypothetical protein